MINYAVCEISGKQVKLVPNKEVEVGLLKADKEVEVNVLLLSEDGKLQIGKPYLKKINLKVLGETKLNKIRVSKFHAKANYRRTTGSRAKASRVVLEVKK